MRDEDEERFRAFVAARSHALLRTAYLLTGDRGHAEDLLQVALVKTYRHWAGLEQPESYVRRVLVHQHISGWRRKRVTEQSFARLPETAVEDRRVASVDTRDELWRALATLPPRTRAVLVLRYWQDLSETETAHILGCSVGSVKSQASRGLARLRERVSRASSSVTGEAT